jgi:hypothetical protein
VNRLFLIASAAYVEPELAAEFGRLPPAFLPLGNRRLFEHQRAALGDTPGRLLLSLPEDFSPEPSDLRRLAELRIEVLTVPPGLTLGQSLVYVINVTATSGAGLSVLHGDTLLQGFDLAATDTVSVASDVPPGYHWGFVRQQEGHLEPWSGACEAEADADGAVALTGYFCFADAALLVQSVTRAGGAFVPGLARYATVRPLRTATAAQWFDFGHASTYHASRQAVTTEREFNKLVARRRSITKSGTNPRKIEAEARWFEGLPPPLRVFTPAYLGTPRSADAASYALEYLHLPTLADLFVFGRLSRRAWDQILAACDEFLGACAEHHAATGDPPSAGLYLNKTLRRLERFAATAAVSLSAPCRFGGAWLPALEQMAHLAAAAIPDAGPGPHTLVHGDFCFSNIMYDFRAQRVRVIDPRGLDGEEQFSCFGDIRYDIGKLHHSAVGQYDFILAGAFELAQSGPLDFSLTLPDNASTRGVRDAFLGRAFAGLRSETAGAHPISVLLFLSMLPLHADDPLRQRALLANAMRLFLELDSGGSRCG